MSVIIGLLCIFFVSLESTCIALHFVATVLPTCTNLSVIVIGKPIGLDTWVQYSWHIYVPYITNIKDLKLKCGFKHLKL